MPVFARLEERFERFVQRTRTDSYALSVPGLPGQVAVYCLEMLMCQDRLTQKALAAWKGQPAPEGYRCAISPGQFLQAHGITYEVLVGSLDFVPRSGPAIVVGNHPYGIIEVVICFDLVMQLRKDALVLANYCFYSNPLVTPYMAPIDFRGRPRSARMNLQSTVQFRDHVRNGGIGLMAPSGTVATRYDLSKPATEPEWSTSAARLAMNHNATVVPVCSEGEASTLFHLASKTGLAPRLAVMMLENYRLRRRHLRVAVGPPVSPETLRGFGSAVEATQFLRAQVDGLRTALAAKASPATQPAEAAQSRPAPDGCSPSPRSLSE